MEKNTIHRIKEYIDFKRINVSTFERHVSMSNGSFASQLKNNKTIGVDKLENILRIYNNINAEWLLTGKGDMIKSIDYPVNTMINECIDYKELAEARLEIVDLPLWVANFEASLAILSKISFTNEFIMLIALLETPVSG